MVKHKFDDPPALHAFRARAFSAAREGISMRPTSLLRRLLVPLALLLLALVLLLALPHPAAAGEPAAPAAASGGCPGAVLIWPVDPVIEADARAAALWLENPGKAPITLQVRIYAWTQAGGRNGYAAQDIILGTPPIVTVAPGARQLVRLTRTSPTPSGIEAGYRVVIDEIPVEGGKRQAGAAVSFRMRYSIPLFAYGEGARPPASSTRPASPKTPLPAPLLRWRIVREADGSAIEVANTGPVHARLTQAALVGTSGARTPLADGLLGYVLPGQTMRWPLPVGASAAADFVLSVNGAAPAPLERQPG